MTTISKPTIQSLLFDNGVDVALASIVLPDSLYALPALEWLSGDFATAFFAFRNREGLVYENGDCDCDDFVRAASWYAWKCFRATADRPRRASLAFGSFYFQRDSGEAHALNAAICRDLDALRLVFFEPQLGTLVNLNNGEIQSCNFVQM